MCNDKYIKAEINLDDLNFYGNKMPRKSERYNCLSVILSDSVFNIDKKYYPQTFLKEFKYLI